MRKGWRRVVIGLVTGALLVGCQPAQEVAESVTEDTGVVEETMPMTELPPVETAAEIESAHWQLVAMRAEGGEMEAPVAETALDVRFSEGELAGSAGCNRYFGSYSLSEDQQIAIPAELGSTQMACPPPIAEQEQRYLELLPRAVLWGVDEGTLTLRDEAGLELLEYRPAESASIEGVAWHATGINNGTGGVVTTATTQLSTATFGDGTVTGSGGCNQFNASYELNGDEITIGPAAATRKACPEPEGIMEQEQQFLAALERAKTVTLSPGKLELRDETGALQVGFEESRLAL